MQKSMEKASARPRTLTVTFPQQNNANLRSPRYFEYAKSCGVFAISFKKLSAHNAGKCRAFLEGGQCCSFPRSPPPLCAEPCQGAQGLARQGTLQVPHTRAPSYFCPCSANPAEQKSFYSGFPLVHRRKTLVLGTWNRPQDSSAGIPAESHCSRALGSFLSSEAAVETSHERTLETVVCFHRAALKTSLKSERRADERNAKPLLVSCLNLISL